MAKPNHVALTEDEYDKAFTTYVSCSNEYDDYAVNGNIFSMVMSGIKDYLGRPIDFLSIGPGTGSLENQMVTKGGVQFKSFYAIEPNTGLHSRLAEKFSSWHVDDSTIIKDMFTAEFSGIDKKFDVILMSHILYYFSDPVPVILKARSMLAPGGRVIIFMQGAHGGYQFSNVMSKVYQGCPHSISHQEICAAIDGYEGVLEYDVQVTKTWLQVDDFVRKRESSSKDDVVDFLLAGKYSGLPQRLQDEVYSIVDKNKKLLDGKYLTQHDNAMIRVSAL